MRRRILGLTVLAAWVMGMSPAFSQWVRTNSDTLGWVTCLASRDTMLFAGTQSAGVFVTTDGGAHWNSTGLPGNYISTLFFRDSTLWAGAYGSGIYRTTDNGKHWTGQSTGLSNKDMYGFATSGSNLFVATYGGVSLSTDNGANWKDVDSGLTHTQGVQAVAVLDTTDVFAGTAANGVYRSSDNGSHWSLPYAGRPLYVSAMAVNGSNLFVAEGVVGVYSSTDGGSSWVTPSTNFGFNYVYALQATGTQLFVPVADPAGGAWRTNDNGAHWGNVSTGLTPTDVTSLDTSRGYLYVGTAAFGLWRRPLSEMITSVQSNTKVLPAVFKLLPSYPNSFNPSTRITFTLTKESFATLT